MRNQRSLTKIAGIVTLISIVSYLVSGRRSNAANIVSDLSLAVFGSALLGFIMSLSSYNSAKQQELHDFISAVERYIDQFYWIHPLQIQIPMSLYRNYLFDKDEDASDALYDELIKYKMLRPETQRGLTVAALIHEWVKQTVYDSYTEDDIEEEVNNRLDQVKDQIEWSMNMYKSLPNIDVKEPDRLLGYPVYSSAFMPTIAAGQPVLAFGDFSFYNIADRGTRSFAALHELYAGVGQVAFVAKERVDGKLVLPEAVRVLKMAGTAANG